MDRTLSLKFTVQSFQIMVCPIRSPTQWRQCFTGYEINKAYRNMKNDCSTRDLVLFCDTFELGAADYGEKAFSYCGHFKNKIRVAEGDNAGG